MQLNFPPTIEIWELSILQQDFDGKYIFSIKGAWKIYPLFNTKNSIKPFLWPTKKIHQNAHIHIFHYKTVQRLVFQYTTAIPVSIRPPFFEHFFNVTISFSFRKLVSCPQQIQTISFICGPISIGIIKIVKSAKKEGIYM